MTEVSNTAESIMDSARALILAGGYNGFSYADIAAVVGIRKASIHHHFPSKVDLVCSLVKQYRERSIAGFAALQRTSRDPREQLLKYVAYWEQCIVDASAPFCICALMATELPVLPPAVADEVRLHFSALSAWLTSAFERGAGANLFRDFTDPRAEAESFMALVHGAMISARVSGDPQRFGMITSSALKRLLAD